MSKLSTGERPNRGCPDIVDSTRGVSPAVGVVLLLAIAVAPAAVLGAVATGFGGELVTPAGYASVSADHSPAGDDDGGVPYVNSTHESGGVLDGTEVYIRDSAGNEVPWTDVWTGGDAIDPRRVRPRRREGKRLVLDSITEGETYRVVHAPNGSVTSTTLAEIEIETDPDTTGTYTCP